MKSRKITKICRNSGQARAMDVHSVMDRCEFLLSRCHWLHDQGVKFGSNEAYGIEIDEDELHDLEMMMKSIDNAVEDLRYHLKKVGMR